MTMATGKHVGLLRLRATRDTWHKGQQYRAGDTLLVPAAESEALLAWGAFELTDQARARIYGRDPWANLSTR